jgi:FtsH-binding integral membrane protein
MVPRPENQKDTPVTRIATSFLALAALYLIVGLSLGIGMGMVHEFRFAPVHAHVNLVGWVSHGLMGFAYRQWPEFGKGLLATTQFVVFALSTPVFLAGLVLAIGYDQPLVAIIGSLGVFIGAILFGIVAGRIWLTDRGV